ncbi:MAG: hypothetical protein ACRCTZ_08240 [Sarcina sp.]
MNNVKEYQYIYNLHQANWFIKKGARAYELGTHDNGNVFVKFKREELSTMWTEWINYKNSYKKLQ